MKLRPVGPLVDGARADEVLAARRELLRQALVSEHIGDLHTLFEFFVIYPGCHRSSLSITERLLS